MPQITNDELGYLLDLANNRYPTVCVETGAFEGHFTTIARHWFSQVHSVELSATLAAKLESATLPPHRVHVGDSRKLVPLLALQIQEPVFWFFDANWWKRPAHLDPGIAGSPDEYPLWDELKAVAPRLWGDIIVVNEVDTFGQLSAAGRDRRDVSVEKIRTLYPEAATVLYHNILAIYR